MEKFSLTRKLCCLYIFKIVVVIATPATANSKGFLQHYWKGASGNSFFLPFLNSLRRRWWRRREIEKRNIKYARPVSSFWSWGDNVNVWKMLIVRFIVIVITIYSEVGIPKINFDPAPFLAFLSFEIWYDLFNGEGKLLAFIWFGIGFFVDKCIYV